MKIKIIKSDDKRLKEISKEVVDFTKDYKKIIEQMKDICLEKRAYAAAAPQFGINERFILIMTVDEIQNINEEVKKYTIKSYFNPVITDMVGQQTYYESCMSVDEATGKVKRPFRIKFSYQDIDGDKHKKTVEGFEAIILCHEIDHLEGIEYTERADIMYYDVSPEQRMNIRKKNPHEIIAISETFKYSKPNQIIKKYNEDD